jgi:2,3,4,5-tetrahydropyridine-2-carboxylate N-succinyltransferase|tara:strand:- start:1271 stop:2083 length:813 start_codon:yes stop_codon:yes gene_type:complete
MNKNQEIIEQAYSSNMENMDKNEVSKAVEETITSLNSGELRVAEYIDNDWKVNQWVKKAILVSFKLRENKITDTGYTKFYDKLTSKFNNIEEEYLKKNNIRVVPQAIAREGTYVGKNVVLMPSFMNIGAYVDDGSMVDTWATVGSCAQIGKNVHLSGGVGIGGVLEPLQANPTIIEDNCFIGARSEIVEGVIVKKNSVISMGVYIGQSTKIYDRETGEVSYGIIPEGSVVVSGSLPSKDQKYSLYCAVIVKKVDEKTRSKVGINELLREA